MSKNLKRSNLTVLSLYPSEPVGPFLCIKVIIPFRASLAAPYVSVKPCMHEARQSYHKQVQRAEIPALEDVSELMPHSQLLSRTHYYVLSEGYASREGIQKVEPDVPQSVSRLPFEDEQ